MLLMGLDLNSPDFCKENATQVGDTQSLVWDLHHPGDQCDDEDDPVQKLCIRIRGSFSESQPGKPRHLSLCYVIISWTPGLGDQKMPTGS